MEQNFRGVGPFRRVGRGLTLERHVFLSNFQPKSLRPFTPGVRGRAPVGTLPGSHSSPVPAPRPPDGSRLSPLSVSCISFFKSNTGRANSVPHAPCRGHPGLGPPSQQGFLKMWLLLPRLTGPTLALEAAPTGRCPPCAFGSALSKAAVPSSWLRPAARPPHSAARPLGSPGRPHGASCWCGSPPGGRTPALPAALPLLRDHSSTRCRARCSRPRL